MWLAAFLLALSQVPARTVDACGLLTNAEVQAVLGGAVKERVPNAQPAGGLLMSQCFFATSSPRSLSMAVAMSAQGRGGRRITPREYWRQQFHRRGGEEAHGGEREPRRVPGIGDEAYWAGNRIAGALYVLRGDTFIRVSVGGIVDERERIARSTALARAALPRLSGGR